MSEGRGSASATLVMAATLIRLMVLLRQANAATYTVGGPTGWTFNTDTWLMAKTFRAGGDVLVFKHDSTAHNVVAVDRKGYSSCSAPAGAKVFRSGNDQVRLGRGLNYFICSYPGHCQSGMKIAINAL